MQRFAAPTLADMRAALTGCYAGKVTRYVDDAFVQLERDGAVWTLRITDTDKPVTHATCDRVATAVGAPSLDWRREQGGAVAWATWCEWWQGWQYLCSRSS
jgi:hypothetical protein